MNKSKEYISNRDIFRVKHKSDFLNENKNTVLLIQSLDELVASQTLYISGRKLSSINNGIYIGDLICSFCRTHFIISDFIQKGDLIESGVLIRK